MTQLELAHDRVPDICRELGLSNEVREQAVAYAKRADYEHPINRSAAVVAAGSVYLVALLYNEKRTQQQVAAAADVSKVSIREAYVEIGEAEGYDMGRGGEDGEDEDADDYASRGARSARIRQFLNRLPWRAEP